MSPTPELQPADLARLLRDVTEVTTRQQVTFDNQIAQHGFVSWLHQITALPGVHSKYLSQPTATTFDVLHVDLPAKPPKKPNLPELAEGEQRTPEDEALLQQFEADHKIWVQHRALYDNLFEARTPPEGFELVFGVGLLSEIRDLERFRRHLVTRPADIVLDRSTQALRVRLIGTSRQELNWATSGTRTRLSDATEPLQDLQDAQSAEDAGAAVDAIRSSFGRRCAVLTEPNDAVSQGTPGLALLPAVLLRRRDSSHTLQLMREMVDDMDAGGFVSEPFQMLVSPTHSPTRPDVIPHSAALPLPANEEQRAMINNARTERHLVVQGPPGTGKTHTIANLASVLMAEGRRVLITAENERALVEVQGKLPAHMQPLMLPMLTERGTGPLQNAVNALSAKAGQPQDLDAREAAETKAREHLAEIEAEIRAAETELATISFQDQEVRVFGDLSMPLEGHLIRLATQAAELNLVDTYLADRGTAPPEVAASLLTLTQAVTAAHQNLSTFRFPEGLPTAPEMSRWLQDYRSKLGALGDPNHFDHAALVADEAALLRLSGRLQSLPAVPWTAISFTCQEYEAFALEAESLARQLDHSVVVSDPTLLDAAFRLCEEYLALDAGRFDAPLDELLDRHRKASSFAAACSTRGDFSSPHRTAELTRTCEDAIATLKRDCSGLLTRHVVDHQVQSHSPIDQLVEEARGLLAGARDEVGLVVTVADGAPAPHRLAQQAETLAAHLRNGGKLSGMVRTPPPVKQAHDLLTHVQVGGSSIETAEEAERAATYLQHRRQLAEIDNWAQSHELDQPADVPVHVWLTAITEIPELSQRVREAHTAAEQLVHFPYGTAPADPTEFFEAVLGSISEEEVGALAGLVAAAAAAPTIRIAGLAIGSRHDCERALGALNADRRRRELHSLLPDAWKERCNPVEVDTADSLVTALDVAADAARVPGPARTATLSPSAVNQIVTFAQADQRRAELLNEHAAFIGGARQQIAECVPQSPATRCLDAALVEEDPVAYGQALTALADEVEHASLAHQLADVRATLQGLYPDLLAGLDAQDPDAVTALGSLAELETLRDHRHAVRRWQAEVGSTASIHDRLAQLFVDARRAEEALASLRAWDKAIERIQAERALRSALSALTNAMEAVPKTRSAKTYPARMRALQAATQAAAPAIPCWVMTIDRVAEVLGYPTGTDRFDVVIVDEASQAWFPSMFLYAIADQVIVVGDKLQTSPAAQLCDTQKLATIAKEHIPGHRLQDRIGDDLSLYDIAEVMTGPDMMADHFRCAPEIIDISNRLSYEPMGRRLQPSKVREPGSLEPVCLVRVNGVRSGTEANRAEVDEVVNTIVQCHGDPAYKDLDFGVVVVSPSPNAHLKHIRQRLLETLGPEAIRDRNLEVGTANQFQGAERDVMFLSLAVGPKPGERIRVWPHEHTGRNRRNVQALNVAVSRARDQLWIFHSFDPSALSPDDARLVLLEKPNVPGVSLDEQLARCESGFERDVVQALADADPSLQIRTQVEALGYALDVVVEDEHGHRLAVECDGDRWHSSESQIRGDLYRQRTLESIGWRFHRFLASEWYSDPQRHLQAILDELQKAQRPVRPPSLPAATSDFAAEDDAADWAAWSEAEDANDEADPFEADDAFDVPANGSWHQRQGRPNGEGDGDGTISLFPNSA